MKLGVGVLTKNQYYRPLLGFLASIWLISGSLSAAEKSKKEAASGSKVREKNIIREKQYKGKQSKIDFDSVDIVGEKKTPYGSALTQRESDKNVSLIKIRKHWHQEMVQSTSSLETGKK